MPEPGFVQHVRRIAAGEPMFVDVVSVQLFVEDRDALKVRVTELEAAVAKQEIAFQGRALLEEMWRKEKVALQARIEELEGDHQTFWAKKPGGVEMWEQHLRNLVDGTDEYFEPFAMEIAVAELNRQRARVEELEGELRGLLAPGVHGNFIAAAADNARVVLAKGEKS